MEVGEPLRSPAESTWAAPSNVVGKILSAGDQISAAKSAAIASAMRALDSPDALASAQKHLENLSKLETLSGVTRRRDTIQGAVILFIVLAAVGLSMGIKLGSIAAAASVSARELVITTASVLVRTPATYINARVVVGGDAGVDAEVRKLLAEPQATLAITEIQQTSDVLRTVLRQEDGCHLLVVREGSLAISLSSATTKGAATAQDLVLRGSNSKAASLTICGVVEQPLAIAARLSDMTIEQRVNHGVLATEVLPSVLSGELDIGGRRMELTPLDVLFVRVFHDEDPAKASAAFVDMTATAVSVRLSANVSELTVGTVHDQKDRMPNILESLSRDSPLGTVYSSALAAFAFLWGLRKVLVA